MTTFKEIQAYYNALKVAFQSKQESNTFNNDRSLERFYFQYQTEALPHGIISLIFCHKTCINNNLLFFYFVPLHTV